MGEIADMMLDGDLCEECGAYIDGGSFGVPRKCSSCLAGSTYRPRHQRKKNRDKKPTKKET